ncbi:MAG: UDP-N-acetylmuramoyl-tripeptide--D-alanyl-D-alanine ligase, partial [Nocardioidaceae bacterium]|nr:UDP-N-acetylmuramoyl-tripeptide--D-alanyl-D-alanine ligase [Nocardioidaceae bacterium]
MTGASFVDSRYAVSAGLFVAVVGEHVDGHDYAAHAVSSGAAAALTTRQVGVPAVVVRDTVVALGLLARHVVAALPSMYVVGVTGSQGKTSTKDLLAQVCERSGDTVAPAESLNN